ncbi:MAG: hypothetical protein ABI681_06580 [Gemmatimonadales bacterium]
MATTRILSAALAIAAISAVARSQSAPPELIALAGKARLDGNVSAWCRGEFRGKTPAYAVAISDESGGGRYVIIKRDASVVKLAAFAGTADLSCYTPAQARELDRSIRDSEGVHGTVTLRWSTTVVCGFVDDTHSICWQYSPVRQAFVKVGEWIT